MLADNLEKKDLLKEFESYSSTQWSKWIDDITMHGIAHPISTLSFDGDPLKDVFNFLYVNDVETKRYEDGISLCISKSIRDSSFSERTERLLDSLLYVDLESTKNLLLDILRNPEIGTRKGKYDYLASKTIQILTRAELDTDQIRSAYEQSVFYLANQFLSTPSFVGNFLRFTRKQRSVDSFWKLLTHVILIQPKDLNEIDQIKIETVLFDKILELNRYNKDSFYSSFFYWLTENYFSSNINSLFSSFVDKISGLVRSEKMQEELWRLDKNSEERAYGKSLVFLLNLKTNSDLESLSISDWEKNILFIKDKSELFFKNFKRTNFPEIIDTYFEKSEGGVRLKSIVRNADVTTNETFISVIIELLLESSKADSNKRETIKNIIGIKEAAEE